MTIDAKDVPFWTSSRMALSFVGFLGFINLYALRINMSVAIVCMVNNTAIKALDSDVNVNTTISVADQRCGSAENKTNDIEDGEFVWDKPLQGLVLGSFFWGYIVTQIPGGWLASRFGGKRVFGWFMFACAIATLLSPVAARVSPYFLMVLRIIAGLGQGVVWPSMHQLFAQWAPPLERSKLAGFTYAGAQLGNVVTLPFAAFLCEYGFDGGWPSVFYVLGAAGVVWFVVWMFITYDSPAAHPRISAIEKDYIQESLLGHMEKTTSTKVKIPWLKFVKSGPVWAIIITHTCANWGTYTFLTNMPSYMREVLKFDIKANGLLSAIPYVTMWAMVNISANIADALRSRGILGTTGTRKLFNSLGTLVPAVMCIALAFVDCSMPYLGVAFLTIGVSFIGCCYGSGFIVNHIDIAPRYAAILFGISNTAATIPGFMAPYVVGVITKNQTQEEWRVVFYICTAVFVLGAVVYLFLGSGDIQDWAALDDDEKTDAIKDTPVDDNTLPIKEDQDVCNSKL